MLQSFLESIRRKASTATKRKERIDQFQALQYLDEHEKRALADARLLGASERKKERERARAAAAGRHYQMVIERVEEMKARGRMEAAARRARCDARLKEAARRRGAEGLSSVLAASLSCVTSPPCSTVEGRAEGREEKKTWSPRPASSGPSKGRGVMSYDEAVGILRESGIHSSGVKMPALSTLSPMSVEEGHKAIHPPPMNHSSVTMPFDRFAELIADRRILLATQRVLNELLSRDEAVKVNARVFLSAYMIVNYPDVVLSGGAGSVASVALDATQEARLAEAAGRMIRSFGSEAFGDDVDENDGSGFVSRYVAYQGQFMAWKSHDAAGLENDLIKAAVELESSRLVKLGELAERLAGVRYQVDVDALVQGVDHDLMLIEERVSTLTGATGVARLKAALEAVKTAHEQAQLVRDRERNAGANEDEAGLESLGSGTSSLAASPLKTSPLRKMSRREVGAVREGGPVGMVDGDAAGIAAASGTDRQRGNLNLNLMWNLLYDPKWRMPTRVLELQWVESLGGTVDAATLSDEEARSLALERRIWDDLAASLLVDAIDDYHKACEDNTKFISVVKALADVVSKLEEHDRHGGEDEADGAERRLLAMQESLLPKAPNTFFLNVPAFLDAIEWCSNLVLRLCAPARDAEIRRAQRIVGDRFQAISADANIAGDTNRASYTEKMVSAIVQTLHILQLQTRILSLDIANAHLDALTSAMSTRSLPLRINYARKKMAEELGMALDCAECVDADVDTPLPTDGEGALRSRLLSSLGNTRGWIAVASGRLPRLETAFNGAPRSAHDPTSSPSFPIRMRTGTADSTGPNGPSLWSTESTAPELEPIEWSQSTIGWRGLVRVGLVQLISGDGAIGALSIPETLVRDVPRLLALQNGFQKCTVLAICMTVIQGAIPVSSSSTRTTCDVVAMSRKRDAKGRIAAILGDPDVSIDHIAAEVTSCMMELNPTVESFDALQLQVLSILKTLVHRSSTDGRVLVEHLANMITSVLVSGNDDPSYVYNTCSRIGAAEIADDVVDLARRIGEVAAVSEAVCGPWYAAISAEFTN